MAMLLSELAEKLDLQLQGQDLEIEGVNTLEAAGTKELSFLANPKYTKLLSSTQAGAVIVRPAEAELIGSALISENPYLDFARAIRFFASFRGKFQGQSELSFIHPEAEIASDVTIYPHVFVGAGSRVESGTILYSGVYIGENCHIGPGCTLYPQVVLMAGTRLGTRVILHPGVILGSDGFGFAQGETGSEKFPQIGVVVVEDEVEIGANSTVDRAALGETRIGKRTKIDNLVQIGHNVQIGEDCILVAQVGIAGSTKLGKRVIMAGQVGTAGHLDIADGCRIGAKSGLGKSLPPNTDVSGIPAMKHSQFLRYSALQPKLPDMYKRLRQLETEVKQLRSQQAQGENEDD